jgi:hypothetical protein
MFGLQKIFSFLHNKPSASHFQIKALNIYFSNSINPVHRLINLERFDTLDFYVNSEKQNENNVFVLTAEVFQGKYNQVLSLATFETKKEAEAALLQVRNKVYGVGKSLFKIANSIIMLIVYLFMFFNVIGWFKPVLTGAVTNQSQASLPIAPIMQGNPALTPEQNLQISQLQKQILANALAQNGQTLNPVLPIQGADVGTAPPPAVEQPQTEATEMLKKLK